MAFTEFYCQSTGSNLNGGSSTATSVYTSTNGNWNGTSTFTPTDGTNPATASPGVTVGDFASIYLDGASVAVYVARVTSVTNATNGAIGLSTTAKMGSPPASGATGRTIKSGGAWLGLNGTSSFPFTLATVGSATDSSTNPVRVNLKNDQTYTLTGSLDISSNANVVLQGYTGSTNDGGRAIITTNVTTSYGSSWTGAGASFVDIIFANTGASNSNDIVRCSGVTSTFLRCVFHGGRASGLFANSATPGIQAIECEWYDNGKANTASKGAIILSGGNLTLVNCYIHDNTGSNTDGIINTGGAILQLFNTIFDTNGNHGAEVTSTTANWSFLSVNCDYYNNTGDGIKFNAGATAGGWTIIRNNNFIKNGGKGINNVQTGAGYLPGIIENNGYGSGTQANGGADVLKSIIDAGTSVTYASGVTAWVDPANEDFNINLPAANFAGRGYFTQTDGTSSVTRGHPDIGAAQSLTGPGGTFSKEHSYGFG